MFVTFMVDVCVPLDRYARRTLPFAVIQSFPFILKITDRQTSAAQCCCSTVHVKKLARDLLVGDLVRRSWSNRSAVLQMDRPQHRRVQVNLREAKGDLHRLFRPSLETDLLGTVPSNSFLVSGVSTYYPRPLPIGNCPAT